MVLPAPVPLADPPGDPTRLEDAADLLTGAGFALGVAEAHLQGPAATAPGWLAADAVAAAAQVGTTRTLLATVHDAVTTAIGLLGGHAELLRTARARVVVLREAQQDGFVEASRRLGLLEDGADPVGASAVVMALAQAEADRAGEHRELVAEVTRDAGSVGARLTASTGTFGGGAGPGSGAADAVTLHLAAVLPGRGDTVLLELGWQVAAELTAPGTAAEVVVRAQRRQDVLADPVVAGALLVALGTGGLEQLLLQAAGDDALAGVLAVALGAALRAGDRVPGAAPVLTGVLDPRDPDGTPDQVAVGMGAVLAVPGAAPELAGAWLAGLLAREAVQVVRVVDRVPSAADPVATALRVLLDAGRPGAAVPPLADPVVWEQLLARTWTDGGAGLADLVALAGQDPTGGTVLTAALTAVGEHLLPAGDHVLTAGQDTWQVIAPTLTEVAVQHVDVLVVPLQTPGVPGSAVVLAGLSLLVVDREQRADVAAGVARAVGPGAGSALTASEAAAVTGALVAVEDQGRRLAWLADVARAVEQAAVDQGWYGLLTMPAQFVVSPAGPFLQGAVATGSHLLDADGIVDLPPPGEPVVGVGGAEDRAVAELGGDPGVVPSAVGGYDTATGVLDLPPPVLPVPLPPEPLLVDRSADFLRRWGWESLPWRAGVGRVR